MIKVSITRDSVETNKAYFNTQEEADAWLSSQEAVSAFGPEGYVVTQSDGSELLWFQVRSKRNALLQQCDFAAMSDYPIADDKKAAFLAYRQALRDLPDSQQDPSNITWPTMPPLKD